jgi:hypothetical protein
LAVPYTCHWDLASLVCWESTPPGTSGSVDESQGLASPGVLESKSQLYKGTWRRLGYPLRALPIRLVRTLVQIIALPFRGRRGDWSPPREPQVTLFGVKLGLR